MKVIVNEYIPFKGFIAFNFFGIIFVRLDEYLKFDKLHNKHAYDVILNHEKIHTEQMKELLYIFFYLIYCVEYLIKFICCFNFHKAYHNVSFEKNFLKEDCQALLQDFFKELRKVKSKK